MKKLKAIVLLSLLAAGHACAAPTPVASSSGEPAGSIASSKADGTSDAIGIGAVGALLGIALATAGGGGGDGANSGSPTTTTTATMPH